MIGDIEFLTSIGVFLPIVGIVIILISFFFRDPEWQKIKFYE